MRAFFHIGRPKTGSTSIQDFLWANRRALAGQRVLYDRIDADISSQWELPIAALSRAGAPVKDMFVVRKLQLQEMAAQQAYADRMLARFEEGLAANAGQMDTYIASSEHAVDYLAEPAHVDAFDRLLGKHFDDITYIIYLREQTSLCASSYSEHIKRGRTISLQEFVRRAVQPGWFDHLRALQPWIDALGPERINVRLMERDTLVGGDLIDDFCAQTGIDPEGLARPRVENPALSRDACEVMRVLNQLLPVMLEDGRPNPLRRGLQERLLERYADAPRLRLSTHQMTHLMKACDGPNETLRQMFWPSRDRLFAERPLPDNKDVWINHEEALKVALSLVIASRQGQLEPLSADDLRDGVSSDPQTACPSGTAPEPFPLRRKVGAIKRRALSRLQTALRQ